MSIAIESEKAKVSARYTPTDLLTMSDHDRFELIDGELVETTVSALSSFVASKLVYLLTLFCENEGQGWVFGGDCGYQCIPTRPNLVRKPDVSVVLRKRLPVDRLESESWLTIAPDLAVEVVSPNDLACDVEQKVQEYLGAGVHLVWVVYPRIRAVRIHRGDGSEELRREADELLGETILPGFRCRVAELFPVH